MGPSPVLGHDAFLRPSWLVTGRHLSRRWESNRALEEDEDHGHRQERVCEAGESRCKFIHLFAPVALSRLADPERAGPIPEGLSLSSPSWSMRQLSAVGAQVALGYAIQKHLLASLADSKGAKVLSRTSAATAVQVRHHLGPHVSLLTSQSQLKHSEVRCTYAVSLARSIGAQLGY